MTSHVIVSGVVRKVTSWLGTVLLRLWTLLSFKSDFPPIVVNGVEPDVVEPVCVPQSAEPDFMPVLALPDLPVGPADLEVPITDVVTTVVAEVHPAPCVSARVVDDPVAVVQEPVVGSNVSPRGVCC